MKHTRRKCLANGISALIAGQVMGKQWALGEASPTAQPVPISSPEEALAALKQGNSRFSSNQNISPRRDKARIAELVDHQKPFAAIISCADSRVIPEIVFDQGIGDLFIVRVAGNVVAKSEAGVRASIEYAVEHLGVHLIVVLGHMGCGAVNASLNADKTGTINGHHIPELVALIDPSIERAKSLVKRDATKDLFLTAIEENVRMSVEYLHQFDVDVIQKNKHGHVGIMGAIFNHSTAQVQWL